MTDGDWFESAWEHREEVIYRGLFGTPEGDGIYVVKPIFFSRFGDQELDPRWLHHGAFVFPPSAQRQSWLYVTSGPGHYPVTDPHRSEMLERVVEQGDAPDKAQS